jgi:hypothetical protein
MSTARFVCGGLLTLICATASSAQAPPQSIAPPENRADPPPAARAARDLANALDQYALVQAQRTLQLNDSQYLQFMPRLKTLQQTRRHNQQARNRLLNQIRQLVGPRAVGEPDEATLTKHLTALREHDERAAREMRAAYDALDEVLTVKQRARFRIFEENIEARKLELLMRARSRAGAS